MGNQTVPGSSTDVSVQIRALSLDPNVSSQYKTKVLQKNVVDGVNTLVQSMMPLDTGQNTKYVIKYDYTLGGNVTIPANCVLEFDGGSISGAYNLNGNNTIIEAELLKIFSIDVTFTGTWKITEAYPEWFGATGIGDEVTIINKVLSSFECKLNGNGKTYTVENVVNISKYNFCVKNINFICKENGYISISSGNGTYINGIIENVNIDCQNINNTDTGILIERVVGCKLININVSNSTSAGFLIRGCYSSLFEYCSASYCINGLKSELYNNADVSNINVLNICHFNHCTNGINITRQSNKNTANGTRMLECWFDYCEKGVIIEGGVNSRIDEGYFENNSVYHLDISTPSTITNTKLIGCYFGGNGSIHISSNSNKNFINNCIFDPSSGVTPIVNDGGELITIGNIRSNGTYINDNLGIYTNGSINNFISNITATSNIKLSKRNDGDNFATATLTDNSDGVSKNLTYGETCEIIRNNSAIQIKEIVGGHTGDILIITSSSYRTGEEVTIISGGNIHVPSGGITLNLYDTAMFICQGNTVTGTQLKHWYLISYNNND